MIIRWPWVLLALVLLAPPPVLSSHLRRVVISARRNAALSVTSLVRPWQNWVDLARSSLGTLIVTELSLIPDPTSRQGPRMLLLQFALLAVPIVFQVTRVDTKASRDEDKVRLLAPIFYLCGITLVLSSLPGLFAVFVGWVFAISSRNPAYQLPAMGLALIAGGYVFGMSLSVLVNAALICIPFFGAFLFRKKLAFVGAEPRFVQATVKPV
jgi:hypothetical protein